MVGFHTITDDSARHSGELSGNLLVMIFVLFLVKLSYVHECPQD